MNVYVETNFVVELALKQEQWASCQEIVGMAQAGRCQLVIPALALIESKSAILAKRKPIKPLIEELKSHLKELARGEPNKHFRESLQPLLASLTAATEQEEIGLGEVTDTVLAKATVLPLTEYTIQLGRVYVDAFKLHQYPDAMMLASVVLHAQTEGKQGLFLNRNHKDFDTDEIKALLAQHNCGFCRNFGDGVPLIRSHQT
jgi:hypothetical protein